MSSAIETDALVVGAGPVGLFQVFELGLQGIQCHVVDSLPQPGGQCVELYGDKPIYDIPAVPLCTGVELIERLQKQIAPLGARFHLRQVVTHVTSCGDNEYDTRFDVRTSAGTHFIARTLFVAGGVGAFQPRTLKIDGAEALEAGQLLYGADETRSFAVEDVLVCGDGQDAIDLAIRLAKAEPVAPRSVGLVHRRDSFKASAGSIAQMRALCAEGRMRLVIGQPVVCESAQGRLSGVQLVGSDGVTRHVAADRIVALLGLSPKLGPIADWGLGIERKQVPVDTEKFETQVPGIYAVGDINHYPGKRKLIVCGFHEATLAAFAAAARLRPDAPIALQYTTTSPKLHKLLGVEPAPPPA